MTQNAPHSTAPHAPATRDNIERLERERARPATELHYTIGGGIEAAVHQTQEAQREAQIAREKAVLQHASDKLRADHKVSKPDARTEYIRQQREAAHGAPSHGRTKNHTR